jgi:hypothetical protein
MGGAAAESAPGSVLAAVGGELSAVVSGARGENASGEDDVACTRWRRTGDGDRRDRAVGPCDDGVVRRRVGITGERDRLSGDRVREGDMEATRWCG